MSIAIIAPNKNVSLWKEKFESFDASIPLEIYPEIKENDAVEVVVLWNHPKGILSSFPNLKLICSMGAGVDHILRDPYLPKGIPITRVVDKKLTQSMTNYVIGGVLNYQRQFFRYQNDQKNKIWDMTNPELEISVGVMGVGELGYDVIEKLLALNIKVVGYGNNPKNIQKYHYFCGDEINSFLKEVNVLICLLPLTKETENILNINLFKNCNKGTYLINVARGKHLVEEDLLLALDEQYLSGAMLDVFREEPLPKSHPFWNHDKILITPHIASVTNPDAAVEQIVNNYNKVKSLNTPSFLIDINKGY
jgi:glyoxylate/hydroxypyruvate reductase